MFPDAGFAEPQILIFDTGPLWELVLYSAVHRLRFSRLKPELQHLQSDSSYQNLSAFIAGFQKKTTTSHVVAEISSRITRTEPKQGHPGIWGLVYTEFSSMRMDEGIMKLLEMPQNLVANIGAVDASILRLGLTLDEAKCVVLSIDWQLISECRGLGLNVKHLWEVVSETN